MYNNLNVYPLSPRPSQMPYLLGIIIGICGVLISGYFNYQNHQAQSWPTIIGHCLDSQRGPQRTQTSRMLSYTYDVEGKEYLLQRFQPAIAFDTPPTIEIAYDPNNPGYGVVKTDSPILLILSFVFFAILGVGCFFAYTGGSTVDVGANNTWHY
jgi:hypothetical protein